ncbi:ATP-dependent DNA helicase [Priestia koreensis]|uniref:ATP-dependent DNA helicase n=1 Tax=Priestia koreensis TaxID=284581 RepID=UPI0030172C2A
MLTPTYPIIFTPIQKDVINAQDGNLLVLAGAGSGKSTVVATRVAEILKNKKLKPENALVFTFTEAAAEDIKVKTIKAIKNVLGDNVKGLAELNIGTIHGFCLNLVQEFRPIYNNFQVLSDVQLKLFVERAYVKAGMGDLGLRPFVDTKLFLSVMSSIRENEVQDFQLDPKILVAKEKYLDYLEYHLFMDFTMIMELALDLLKNDPIVRLHITKKIKYVTIDEYQDVNPLQEKIIEQLRDLGASICAVGDPNQTIYQWRGSDIQQIRTFKERYSSCKTIFLGDNFRSSTGIVEMSKKLISYNNDDLIDINNIVAKSKVKYEDGDIVYQNFCNPKEENQFILENIRILNDKGIRKKDIAILVRTKTYARNLINYLQDNGVNVAVEGFNGLFDTREVEAAAAIFYFMNGTIQSSDLKELWIKVHPTLTSSNIDLGIKYLDANSVSSYSGFSSFLLQKIFQKFLDVIELKEEENVTNKDLEVIMYNLGKFSQVIHDFEYINYSTDPYRKLSSFCKHIEYSAKDYYQEGYLDNKHYSPEEGVRIMTIHQSKGLEFEVVFIPFMRKNLFPIKKRGGRNLSHVIGKNIIPNQERLVHSTEEDERRLFYVALTRSKKYCFLSGANYGSETNRLYGKESQFIFECRNSDFLLDYNNTVRQMLMDREPSPIDTNDKKTIVLNFTKLDDYDYCPYRYKMTHNYGFVQPIHIFMGYGHSMHASVMEVHNQLINNRLLKSSDIKKIVKDLFHMPFAKNMPEIRKRMLLEAQEAMITYHEKLLSEGSQIEFVEKQIEVQLNENVIVNGRMDLTKKKTRDGIEKISIVDFKTQSKVESTSATEEQLKIYAMGYYEDTGEHSDYTEIYNIDDNVLAKKIAVAKNGYQETKIKIENAANNIRNNLLEKSCNIKKCKECHINYLCLPKKLKKDYGITK